MNANQESANLDFLRSFAVLSVVAAHLMLLFQIAPRPLHWLGHLGVLVFFVHTTLVLMFSLERMRAATFGGVIVKFITRRAFRIYPLSILCVLAIWLLHLPVAHLQNGVFAATIVDAPTLWSNLLLVQNLTNTDSMLAPLWSLPLEVQMYLFLPFLFLVAMRSKSVFPALSIWIAAVAAALLTPATGDFLDYVPCFMGGVVAFKMSKIYTVKLPYYLWPVAMAAVSALYLSQLSGHEGWLACLTLGFVIPLFEEMPDGLVRRAAAIVARYSYGIYLAHFICLWFAFSYLSVLPFWIECGVFALTLAILPIAFYHVIENPFVLLGRRLSGAPRSVTPAAVG